MYVISDCNLLEVVIKKKLINDFLLLITVSVTVFTTAVLIGDTVVSRTFSHDNTATIVVFENNKKVIMLTYMYQTNLVRVQLFSYANTSFCSNNLDVSWP